jgi:hypothetical protein
MRQQYEDIHRGYESRRQQGLAQFRPGQTDKVAGVLSDGDEEVQNGRLRDLSQDVVNKVRIHQAERARNKVDKVARNSEELRPVRTPLIVASTLVAIYFDNTFSMNLSDATVLSGYTSVKDQKGRLSVSTPVVSGTVNVDKTVEDRSPAAMSDPSDPETKERYRFALSRPIPFIDVTSGVTYGSTSNAVSASLSKPLTDHITAVVDTIRPVAEAVGAKPAEERVKLVYGLSF